MNKPKGGRGQSVPFDRRTVKVPEPVMGPVRSVIDRFYRDEFKVPETAVVLDDAVDEARKVLKQKKGAKRSIELLMKRIYGVDSVDLSG